MKGYRHALQWVIDNDDCRWLVGRRVTPLSVAAALVAEIYEAPVLKVRRDLMIGYRQHRERIDAEMARWERFVNGTPLPPGAQPPADAFQPQRPPPSLKSVPV